MKKSRFEVRSLSKRYGEHQAVRGVSFAIEAGEHVAVLGPSGSGKSTVLRLLAGLEAPDSGEVLLNGRSVSEPGRVVLPPHRREISMVFQDLALWPNLSAHDNVLMGLSGLKLPRLEARARTREALSLCGVEELAKRRPGTMSGGQQQRIALARAIAVHPAFLLLDEPYAGLDLVIKSRLLAEVHALANLKNMTVILVTHDPREAMSLCRSALVLDQGCLVEAGPLTELLEAPHSDLLCIFRDELRHQRPKRTADSDELEALSKEAFSILCLLTANKR
jgi:ABC-type Fe3+/spermidine/putrescine transport system ATPase subunit